jgi:biopolymer transport protein ExbB
MWQFIKDGGPIMFLLLGTSLIAVTYIIERGCALRWSKVIPAGLRNDLERCRTAQDLGKLQQSCASHPSALSRLLMTAMSHFDWPKTENVDAIETKARREVLTLEKGLVFLEIAVGISPLLGLVGAVHGLITMFQDFGGIEDNTALAKGIAIALNTTLVGLLIAIPSLIAWSYYNKKVEAIAIELESLCDAFLQHFYRLDQE